MSALDEALRLAKEAMDQLLAEGFSPIELSWIVNNGEKAGPLLERFYQLCRDKFAGKDNQSALMHYTEVMKGCDERSPLENLRFFLSIAIKNPRDWLDVEPFLDALPIIHATPSEAAPTEGATPAQEFHCSVSIHGPCQVYLAKDYNELRERVKELEKDAIRYRWMQRWWDEDEALTFKDGIPAAKELDTAIDAAIAKEGTKP